MPKSKGSWAKYAKHYNTNWENEAQFKGWLSRAPDDLIAAGRGEAFCTLCKSTIRAQKNDIKTHADSKGHKLKLESLNKTKQSTLSSFVTSTKAEKTNDLRLAVFIANHSSTRAIDHLGEMIKDMGSGSSLSNLRLHRTKCAKLIENVIAPALLEEVLHDLGNRPFSIVIDESTDIGCEKYMAYVVVYFSVAENRIISHFLGFQEVERATAEDLFTNFVNFFTAMKIDLANLIAIGTDGASNLCGVNNSLYTRLREKLPDLQLIRCVCHSLNRCSQRACEELPTALEFLLRESRSWFSHSSLRCKAYKDVYALINDSKTPPKLTALSATRWLAHHSAVKRTSEQWLELKTFFQMVANTEKCYTAKTLSQMYANEAHYLYLLFLRQALKDITDCNIVFQASNSDPSNVYRDLRGLLLSFARRIFKPAYLQHRLDASKAKGMLEEADINAVGFAVEKAGNCFDNSLLELTDVDFGTTFSEHAKSSKIGRAELNTVMERCCRFMLVLCRELVQRMPGNVAIIQGLRHLTPSAALSLSRAPFVDLPLSLAGKNRDMDAIENQWRLLGTMTLADIVPGVPAPGVTMGKFWASVAQMKNAGGQLIFKDLSDFALRALSLPTSNAVVERVFSVMGVVKCKLRNRMQLSMLIAILRIRLYQQVRGDCCKEFSPTQKMFELFTSKMYSDTINEQDVSGESMDEIISWLE